MSDINKCLAACVEYRAKLDKLEAENAELRNELARVNNQTNWECTCGGTDCAGQNENAELREALASAEVGLKHALMMEPGDPFKRIKAITAALDAVRSEKKEAQP